MGTNVCVQYSGVGSKLKVGGGARPIKNLDKKKVKKKKKGLW